MIRYRVVVNGGTPQIVEAVNAWDAAFHARRFWPSDQITSLSVEPVGEEAEGATKRERCNAQGPADFMRCGRWRGPSP